MSKIVTLRTDKVHRRNKKVIISGVSVEFDALGLADVVERHVEKLVKGGLEIVDESDLKKYTKLRKEMEEMVKNQVVAEVDYIDENKKLKKRIAELETEVASLTELLENFKESEVKGGEVSEINLMTKSELVKLCKQVELPESEWKNLKVDDLKAYIKKKME